MRRSGVFRPSVVISTGVMGDERPMLGMRREALTGLMVVAKAEKPER